MVALLTSVRNSPCFGGLRRTKTCHRQLFARPSVLFGHFLHDAKSDNPFLCREHRGSANLESAHSNNNFPLTKLKPFPKGASRFCKPRFSAHKQPICTNLIKSFSNGSFEVLQTSNQPTKQKLRTNPIKSFATSRQLLLFVRHKK